MFMYNQYNNMGMWQGNGTLTNFPRRSINWNNVLNNTQRTLGIINQAIPIVYQVKPLLNNARTLFRIAGAINEKDDEPSEVVSNNDYDNINNQNYENEKDSIGPKFFL